MKRLRRVVAAVLLGLAALTVSVQAAGPVVYTNWAMFNLTGDNVATGRNTFGTAVDAANTVDLGETAGCLTFEGATADAFEQRVCGADATVGDQRFNMPNTAAAATYTVAVKEFDNAFTVQQSLTPNALTAGTLTVEKSAEARTVVSSFTWTNAMVVALGAATAGDITVATLPAKTVVRNAYVVITGTAAGTTTLTVAFGRTGAGYIDYIVASDAKVAANTVYGDASGERGTNLTGYDLPSYTGTTAVKVHFISTGANLDQVTGSTGRVILETSLVP